LLGFINETLLNTHSKVAIHISVLRNFCKCPHSLLGLI